MTTCDPQFACVFFSAYVEGAANDKLLDVHNACNRSVDLGAEYELVNCGNECDHLDYLGEYEHSMAFSSGAVLVPGATWRVAHPSTRLPSSRPANQTHLYLSNGNDAYGLRHKASGTMRCGRSLCGLVDAIGSFVDYAGDRGWSVAGVSHATTDHTLVRKEAVTHGNCGAWASSAGTTTGNSEWRVLPKGTMPGGASGGGGGTSGGDHGSSPSSSSSSSSSCASHPDTDCRGGGSVGGRIPTDRRRDPAVLTVATWNAEWLYDGVCDPSMSPWAAGSSECVGLASGLNQCDTAGAAAHLDRMSRVMRTLEADVLNVVEVESCAMLARAPSPASCIFRVVVCAARTSARFAAARSFAMKLVA
jgi:hypothetical protein